MITSMNFPAATTAAAPSTAAATDPLANKEVFLQLLVAQLKNQSPDQPQDGVQFITQLAQFTQLEQSTQATQDLDAIKAKLTPATTPTPTPTGGN